MANGRCRMHGGTHPGEPRGERRGKTWLALGGDNRAPPEDDSRGAEDTRTRREIRKLPDDRPSLQTHRTKQYLPFWANAPIIAYSDQ
jgi:hypothetical protein